MEDYYGLFDAKNHFSELINRVLDGEVLTVTKHGKPVAKIIPFETEVEERSVGCVLGSIGKTRACIASRHTKFLKNGESWKSLAREGLR